MIIQIENTKRYYWFARGSGGGDEIWWRWDLVEMRLVEIAVFSIF